MDKLLCAVTVKLCEADSRFVENRARQLGMESQAEYMRHLVSADRQNAELSLKLLALALDRQVSDVFLGNLP